MSTKQTQSKLKNWEPDPNITGEELERMRVEVYDRIVVARIGLLLRHPFFGNMATRLRILAADDWLMTAAVDGKNLYYNTQFFNAMNTKRSSLLLLTRSCTVFTITLVVVTGKVVTCGIVSTTSQQTIL